MRFKDISEVHNYSVQMGKPELFDEIVRTAIQEALESFNPDSGGMGAESGLNKSLPVYTVGEIKEQSQGTQEEGWYCPLFMRKGEITLFAGESKRSGKTTFYMHALKATHDGADFLGMTTTPTKSLVLTEQGNNILESTARAGIQDDDEIFICPFKDVSREKWPLLIEKAIYTCEARGIGILVVDTFSAFARLRGSDENLSGEVLERMEPIIEAARVHDLHISLLHHTGKDGEIRGSSGFNQEPDIIWVLKRPPGEHGPNVRALQGLGRHDEVNTTFNIGLEDSGYVLLGTNTQIELRKAKNALLEKIPIGKKNAVRRTEVLKNLSGISSSTTLQRALEDLTQQRAVLEETQKGKGNPKILWRSQSTRIREKKQEEDLFKPDSGGMGAESGLNKSEPPDNVVPIRQDLGDRPPPEKNQTEPEEKCELIETPEALTEAASRLKDTQGPIGFDVETYPQDSTARALDPRRGKVGVVSLAVDGLSFVIDAKKLNPPTIRKALEDTLSGRALIAHNAPFDLAFLRRSIGYEHAGPVYDTLVLDAMLFYATGPLTENKGWRGFTTKDKENGYKRSLKDVVHDQLGLAIDKEERSGDWGGELTPEMVGYAAKDASILLPLKDELVGRLDDLGMTDVVDIEARFTPAMAYASDNGFALDVKGWKKHATEAKEAYLAAKLECDKLAPEPPEDISNGEWAWNASNHHKVGTALELLGAKVEKSPKGNYKTDEDAVERIKKPAKAKRLAQAILKYRSYEKFVTTWGENWFNEPWLNTKGRVHQKSPDHMIVVDGRVYAKFNQLVASGRGSSRQPNMQNLPPEIRRFFVAPPGRKLLIADYSQIEYVAAAHVAGDEALLEPLREGRDFHQVTAEMIGTDRTTAKTVNFAVLYGMGEKALAKKLTALGKKAGKRREVTEREAWGYIRKIFERAPALYRWWIEQGDKAEKGVEYATTALGRRRLIDMNRRVPYGSLAGQEHLLGQWQSNRSQLLNHPIQGACADGYKMAGALIWESRSDFASPDSLIVNMVHDEYVLEVDAEAAEADAKILESLMIQGMKAAIGDAPITVEVEIADTWGKKD